MERSSGGHDARPRPTTRRRTRIVVDRDRVDELDGEGSRAPAAVGAFRIVPEHDLDLRHDTLENLHAQSLVELVDLGENERDQEPSQTFYAGAVARGRSTTTRISTRRFHRKKVAFETMAGSFTKTSNCSRRTTSALTPSAAPRPAFASTWSPLAVVVVAPGRVRAGRRSSYDARIASE
jgi:hypothetical protein